MGKYRVYFKETTEKFFYVDVEANNSNDAMKIVDSGRHIYLPHHKDNMMKDNVQDTAEEYEEIK